MTPPKESSSETGAATTSPLQAVESRDLYTELRDMRRRKDLDGKIELVDVEDPQHYGLDGLTLPPQANPEISDRAQTLDQIRSDIDDQLPKPTSPESAILSDPLSQRLAERQQVPLEKLQIPSKLTLAEVRDEVTGARSVSELRQKVMPHAVEYGLVEAGEWFQPMPGNREAALILEVINQERATLEKRSAVERARDAASRAFDTLSEVKTVVQEREAARKEHTEKLLTEREVRSKAVKGRVTREAEERTKAEERYRLDAEARLVDDSTFSDYMAEAQAEARRPFDEQIARLRRREEALTGLSGGVFRDSERVRRETRKQVEELQKQAQAAERRARKEVLVDRAAIAKEMDAQADAILDLKEAEGPAQHIYKPNPGENPDRAVAIAATNSELLGKLDPPYQVDEYELGDSVMQRIVFLTADKGVLIVEDWDKTAGVLKRQSVIKGKDLLISESENAGHGRIRRRISRNNKNVLSNEAYKALGPFITKEEVSADSGTSYETGSLSYAKRLTRMGVQPGSSYELASGAKKPKDSPGFMAMLQKGFERAVAAKK